ncbi:MAG TPA: tetratricopeptide repeat protein, partial [Ktedonobacteraceae bacterium]|nr:tetratricopeptide repeat protein [Ktedonobacteraceae bacterium]
DFPPSFENEELGMRRHMLLGLAFARIGNFADSETHIGTAEEQCSRVHCELDGEIARARGAIEVRRANLPAADTAFRKSLQIARQRGDSFLEATDLLNLGAVSLRNSRYDDAIDWSNAAAKKFHELGSELDESKIAGNIGWTYFKLGDYNQAFAMTANAQSQAHKLGAVLDEIAWLNSLGMICFQTGKSTLAENYYQRALELAEKTENNDLRFQVLTELAFVSVQLGRQDAAQQFKDKAYELAHNENDRSAEMFIHLIEGQLAASKKNYGQAEQLFTDVARAKESISSLRWQAQNELARLHETENQIPLADKEYREALNTVTCARSALAHEEFRLPFQ